MALSAFVSLHACESECCTSEPLRCIHDQLVSSAAKLHLVLGSVLYLVGGRLMVSFHSWVAHTHVVSWQSSDQLSSGRVHQLLPCHSNSGLLLERTIRAQGTLDSAALSTPGLGSMQLMQVLGSGAVRGRKQGWWGRGQAARKS